MLEEKLTSFKSEILDEFKDLLTKQYIPKTLDEDSCRELKAIVRTSVAEAIESFSKSYEERMQKLESKVIELESNMKERTQELQEAVDEKTSSLVTANEQLIEKVKELEEEIEERTNRSLRSTLVFKNIPQSGKETWAATTNKTAEAIKVASRGTISFDAAHSMLERCHRGKPSKKGKKSSPTPIYALIDDWRNAEWIKDEFRKKPKDCHYYVDQKYGKRTTWRRNQALLKRKELKGKGEIVNGYVDYPAILMVRKKAGDEYKEYSNFSNMTVVFDE